MVSEMNLKETTTIYDFEVFAHNWFVVFKRLRDGVHFGFHNDNEGVRQFMLDNVPLLCGFNNKHYDNFILKAVLVGCSPEEVKQVNDEIIVKGTPGWNIPFLRDCGIWFDSFDLMDDMQMGLSLKAIEAHLGMDIEETEVDFNLDRALTIAEQEKTFKYCQYDVDATEKLFDLRKDYLENKIKIGQMRGLREAEALYMTNPKLTATYLQARQPEKFWNDERNYRYPKQLLTEYIPEEVIEYATAGIKAHPELPFFIYASNGGKEDIEEMRTQMKYLTKQPCFSYGPDPAKNNIYYSQSDFYHTDYLVPYYFWNSLAVLFH